MLRYVICNFKFAPYNETFQCCQLWRNTASPLLYHSDLIVLNISLFLCYFVLSLTVMHVEWLVLNDVVSCVCVEKTGIVTTPPARQPIENWRVSRRVSGFMWEERDMPAGGQVQPTASGLTRNTTKALHFNEKIFINQVYS